MDKLVNITDIMEFSTLKATKAKNKMISEILLS